MKTIFLDFDGQEICTVNNLGPIKENDVILYEGNNLEIMTVTHRVVMENNRVDEYQYVYTTFNGEIKKELEK